MDCVRNMHCGDNTNANCDEEQYLNQLKYILEHGNRKDDRTGTGTLSVFGMQSRYNLRNGVMPLLTTKRVFFRGIAEELLWFIRGSTNAKELSEKKVNIWDGNGSRAFLDANGFNDRDEGDLGPVYGFQWRHFGAEYKDMHTDYTGQGVDQLAQVIERIKNKPHDRRILLCAWNVKDVPQMALPPCHCLIQFYVCNNELSCQMYQRSADMGLGVPFNIASYALLTHMIAEVTDLKAAEFIHAIGDAHIYTNHVDALKQQIVRQPREFPTIKFRRSIRNIDDFEYSDFIIDNYDPYPAIKMQMAV